MLRFLLPCPFWGRRGGKARGMQNVVSRLNSEQRQVDRRGCPERVVVHLDAGDSPRRGEGASLRLDPLGRQDPSYRAKSAVPIEALEVPGQLLDAVDLPPALDLDRDGTAGGVAAEQVDGTDIGRVLAPYQAETGREDLRPLCEQPLQVGLDAVLLEARVAAQLMADVDVDRLDRDREEIGRASCRERV